MPTYTYQCPKCGKKFERYGVPMKEADHAKPCPSCWSLSPRTVESVKSVGVKVRW